VANAITLTATVESDIVDNSGDLEWWLVVCSSCPVHLQYGKISISSTLDDGVTTNHTGSGNTLTMGQSLTYKFPFKERYESRKGILRVDATLDYGLIDYPT